MQRYIYIWAVLLTLSFNLAAQNEEAYNKELADSLGADEYGMRMYQFVILKTGPEKITDEKKVGELFKGHLQNIKKLVAEGKLIVAGPFENNANNYRGLFIFKVESKEKAEQLLATDPAVKAGLLAAEIYGWYGPAALPMYIPQSKIITKKSF